MANIGIFQARYSYCKGCGSLRYKPLSENGSFVPCFSCDTASMPEETQTGWFWEYVSLPAGISAVLNLEPFGPFASEIEAKDDAVLTEHEEN